MASKKRLHYKDLDVFRFLAFLPIFLYCAFFLLNVGDNAAIADATTALGYFKQNCLDFFFFASAFLLTSHALREYKYKENFGIKHFYIRRLIRITPVLLVALIFAFFVHPWVIKTLELTEINAPEIKTFIVNTPDNLIGISSEQYIFLASIWVIFMFIQFYLFWGIVLKFFIQNIKYVGYALIAVGIASRIYHVLLNIPYEFNVLTAGIPVGMGAITSQIVRNEQRTVEFVKHAPKGNHVLVYIIGLVAVFTGYLFLGNTYAIIVIPMVTCAFYGYVFMEQTYGKSSIVKFRKAKILTRLGKISYGMLMYSPIVLVLGDISMDSLDLDLTNPAMRIIFLVTGFFVTWLISDLSYNFYERPLLSIKKDFKRS